MSPFPIIFHPRKLGEKSVSSRQINRNNVLDSNRNLNTSDSNPSSLVLVDCSTNISSRQFSDRVGRENINKISVDFSLNLRDSSSHLSMDPDTIFKALRLVPDFDGNANILTRFIKICDQIVLQYIKNDPGYEFSNLCLLNGILNKITGAAARTINSNGIPDSWLGIREALINNFADQRDETALYNDLSLASQGNESPQEFYDKCQTLFSTIMTYVSLHESVPTTIEAKRNLYRNLTKQAYVRGLKEPLGSRIRCMRPESIEKALEFVQEELNVMYLQQRNSSPSDRRPPIVTPPAPKVPYPNHFSVPNLNAPGPSWQRPMFTHGNGPQHWRPPLQFNQPTPRMPMQPTRTQQMFKAPPPNYINSGFRVPHLNAQQTNGPKPMSGVSHFSTKPLPPRIPGHDWRRFGNPPPSNYFKSREINLNESYDIYDNNYNYYPDYYYYQADYTEPDYNSYYDHQTVPGNIYENDPQYTETQLSYPAASIESAKPSTKLTEQDFHENHHQVGPE